MSGRAKFRTFSEKSMDYWRQYVCDLCKHLVFQRHLNKWACDKGHAATKEYCDDWIDDTENTRVRMPDGCARELSVFRKRRWEFRDGWLILEAS